MEHNAKNLGRPIRRSNRRSRKLDGAGCLARLSRCPLGSARRPISAVGFDNRTAPGNLPVTLADYEKVTSPDALLSDRSLTEPPAVIHKTVRRSRRSAPSGPSAYPPPPGSLDSGPPAQRVGSSQPSASAARHAGGAANQQLSVPNSDSPLPPNTAPRGAARASCAKDGARIETIVLLAGSRQIDEGFA